MIRAKKINQNEILVHIMVLGGFFRKSLPLTLTQIGSANILFTCNPLSMGIVSSTITSRHESTRDVSLSLSSQKQIRRDNDLDAVSRTSDSLSDISC